MWGQRLACSWRPRCVVYIEGQRSRCSVQMRKSSRVGIARCIRSAAPGGDDAETPKARRKGAAVCAAQEAPGGAALVAEGPVCAARQRRCRARRGGSTRCRGARRRRRRTPRPCGCPPPGTCKLAAAPPAHADPPMCPTPPRAGWAARGAAPAARGDSGVAGGRGGGAGGAVGRGCKVRAHKELEYRGGEVSGAVTAAELVRRAQHL